MSFHMGPSDWPSSPPHTDACMRTHTHTGPWLQKQVSLQRLYGKMKEFCLASFFLPHLLLLPLPGVFFLGSDAESQGAAAKHPASLEHLAPMKGARVVQPGPFTWLDVGHWNDSSRQTQTAPQRCEHTNFACIFQRLACWMQTAARSRGRSNMWCESGLLFLWLLGRHHDNCSQILKKCVWRCNCLR